MVDGFETPADRKVRILYRISHAIRTSVQAGANAYANGIAGEKPIVDKHFTAGNQLRYGWAPLSEDYARAKMRGIVKAGGAAFHLNASEMKQYKAKRKELAKKASIFKAKPGDDEDTIGAMKDFRADQLRANKVELADFVRKLTGGRQGSRLDKNAEYMGKTATPSLIFGAQKSIIRAGNLPMLVLNGQLRAAVTGRKHTISTPGDGSWATIHFAGLPDYAEYHHTGTAKMPKRSPVEPNEQDRLEVMAVMRRHIDAAIGTGGRVAVSRNTIPGMARLI